jgi:C1A family cysteine protease
MLIKFFALIKSILGFKKKKRRYNWKSDLPDKRDYNFALKMMPLKTALPSVVDLTSLCSPVEDQGALGSCTSQALAGLLEFAELAELRAHQTVGSNAPELYGTQYTNISRLFIYYGERVLEGTVNQDAGATLRSGIKVLAKQGACRESLWDYTISNLLLRPTQEAYAEASQHKIQQYMRLRSFLDMKHCLASGYPFAFGMMVPEELESRLVARTGIMPDPTPSSRFMGGHAVMCVGYNDVTRRVKIRNSWSSKWGDKGYFTMSYDFIANPQYCLDFWTLIK